MCLHGAHPTERELPGSLTRIRAAFEQPCLEVHCSMEYTTGHGCEHLLSVSSISGAGCDKTATKIKLVETPSSLSSSQHSPTPTYSKSLSLAAHGVRERTEPACAVVTHAVTFRLVESCIM